MSFAINYKTIHSDTQNYFKILFSEHSLAGRLEKNLSLHFSLDYRDFVLEFYVEGRNLI